MVFNIGIITPLEHWITSWAAQPNKPLRAVSMRANHRDSTSALSSMAKSAVSLYTLSSRNR